MKKRSERPRASEPEPQGDNAHVLNTGISEQPFIVFLAEDDQRGDGYRDNTEEHEQLPGKGRTYGCIGDGFKTQQGEKSDVKQYARKEAAYRRRRLTVG